MPHTHHHLFIGIGIAALLFTTVLTFALSGATFSTEDLTEGVAEKMQQIPRMRSVTTFHVTGDVSASGNLTLNIAQERGKLASSSGRFSLSLTGSKGTALTEGALTTSGTLAVIQIPTWSATGTMQRLDTLFTGLAAPNRIQEALPRQTPIMGGSPLLMMASLGTLDSVTADRTTDTVALTGKGTLYGLPVHATLTAARESKLLTKETGSITLPTGALAYQTSYSESTEPITPLTAERGMSGELVARALLEILQIK